MDRHPNLARGGRESEISPLLPLLPMTEPNSTGPGDLAFDKAVPSSASAAGAGITCSSCGVALRDTYHTAGGAPVCASCRVKLTDQTKGVTEPALLAKAAVCGFGASIVGAIIYFAVLRFLGWQISLIAILAGWMIGKSVRKGANGRGGRLLQVGAALLTYLSVAMAYLPFALGAGSDDESVETSQVTADSTAAAAAALPDTAGTLMMVDSLGDTTVFDPEPRGFLFVLLAVGALALALPLLSIFGSGAGGLISALIIGFGMMQAWQLTGRTVIDFQGPFRVGGEDPASG